MNATGTGRTPLYVRQVAEEPLGCEDRRRCERRCGEHQRRHHRLSVAVPPGGPEQREQEPDRRNRERHQDRYREMDPVYRSGRAAAGPAGAWELDPELGAPRRPRRPRGLEIGAADGAPGRERGHGLAAVGAVGDGAGHP